MPWTISIDAVSLRRAMERVLGVPRRYNASLHPDLPGPAQTRVGAWFDRHDRLVRIVGVAAVVLGFAYLVWRVGWSFGDEVNTPLSIALFCAEVFGWWSLVALTWFSWSRTTPVRPDATPLRRVDVVVCTYDESPEVLRTTLIGCRAINYPHQTYLLDDGRRPEMRELAEQYGATWLTRPDNSHAKAGNINAALPRLDGELVFVLDADHVPLPDALDALVGYFDEPDVAIVQTPHDFYNHDSAQHYGVGRHEQSVFFEVVMPGKDSHDAAFWCGSATLIRRDALMGIGGVATDTIAEDFHTTIKLHADGWTTRYHHETVIQGLAPHSLDGYLLQRDRWARGNLAVFTTPESPLRNRRLSIRQRLSYLASLVSYGAPTARLVMIAVLVLTLVTGQMPLAASLEVLGGVWLPWVLMSMLAATALCRGHMRFKESIHYELVCAEIYTRAWRCAVSPARTAFKVTPKEGTDAGGLEALRMIRVVVFVAFALTGLAVARLADWWAGTSLLPHLPGVANWIVPALALIEARRCWRTVVLVGRRHQIRGDYRFPIRLTADVLLDGERCRTRVTDASGNGVGIRVPADKAPAIGERVEITTTLPTVTRGDVEVTLPAVVRLSRPAGYGARHLGCTLVDVDPDVRDLLIETCFLVVPYERLRGTRPTAQPIEPPVVVDVVAATDLDDDRDLVPIAGA